MLVSRILYFGKINFLKPSSFICDSNCLLPVAPNPSTWCEPHSYADIHGLSIRKVYPVVAFRPLPLRSYCRFSPLPLFFKKTGAVIFCGTVSLRSMEALRLSGCGALYCPDFPFFIYQRTMKRHAAVGENIRLI